MTLIEFPRKPRMSAATMLVLVDLQREYETLERPYAVPQVEPCLENCGKLLAAAREIGLPIAHFRQLHPGPFFNEDSEYSHWIDGFQPRPCEHVYERRQPSCFRNEIFADYMEAVGRPTLLLAGLTVDRACLATVLDAVQRRHEICFVKDASASRHIGQWGARMSHAFLTDLVSQYCPVIDTGEALQQIEHADPTRWEAFGG